MLANIWEAKLLFLIIIQQYTEKAVFFIILS